MELGQTLDSLVPREIFSTPLNNISPTSIKLILEQEPGTTCNSFYVSLYDTDGFEAVSSNETITLTTTSTEYTLTFSALDTMTYPSGYADIEEIRLNYMTNSGLCTYYTKLSDVTVSGESFSNDESGRAMYYQIFGTTESAPVESNLLYNLNITYPVTARYPYYELPTASTTEIFKVSYRLPASSYRDTRALVVWSSDYPDFSANTLQSVDDISTLDPDNTGVMSVPITFSSTSPTYIEMSIVNNLDSGDVKTTLNFTINASSSQLTNLKNSDLGFWGNMLRSLFVPSDDSLLAFTSVTDDMQTKKPFNYYTEVKELFDTVSVSSTTPPSLSFDMVRPGRPTTTVALLDFEETTRLGGASSFSVLYDLVSAGMWLFWGVFVYKRLTGIFAPHQGNLF